MKKLWALIVARNKEFYRDRTTLGWTLLFPFIVLAGFAYGITGKQDPVLRMAVVGAPSTPAETLLVNSLEGMPGVALVRMQGEAPEARAIRKLERYETDLVLLTSVQFGAGGGLLYSINRDSEKGKLAERLLTDDYVHLPDPKPRIEERKVEGHRVRYADWVLPGLLAMNIMFGSMFGVGYVIVRYRKNGVLKRLRATPLSAFQFLTAQVFSRMLLMIVTSLMVVVGAMILIGFKFQGSWLDLIVYLAVSSVAMISVGLIVAARISSEEAAEGILNLMTWPMIFLSGIWFSLDGASSWVLFGARLVPLTHVVDGLRAIMIDGASLVSLLPEMAILLVLSAAFIALGSLIFKWR